MAYETWGRPSPSRDNAVLVLHALTADSHAAGPAGPGHVASGWWDGLIGPGAPIDTDRWWVVCPNVLGGCQGTTGPSSAAPDGQPWGSRFPVITVRDQVAVEAALADRLGIRRWAAVVGGSMGGMRVLEWAVGFPDRVGLDECQSLHVTGRDVAGHPNLGSERLGGSLFYPAPDDEQSGPMVGHGLTVSVVPSPSRYRD